MKKIRKAVIPAAGWGTRCLPTVKAIPKEMLPIVDKPAIQYVIEEAAASGITDILIITSRHKESIEDHFDRNLELEGVLELKGKKSLLDGVRYPAGLANLYFTRQQEAKGLGHAVQCASEFVGEEPFALLLPDDLIVSGVPCLKQLLKIYQKWPGTILAVQSIPTAEVSRYGIIDPFRVTNKLFIARDLVEKPAPEEAPSKFGIVGRYVLEPGVFQCLKKVQPGAIGEIQLTDALKLLAQTEKVYGYRFRGQRYDVGDVAGYLKANVVLGLEHPVYGPLLEGEIFPILEKKFRDS